MVGSDLDLDWSTGQFTANAAERAAFANGYASRDAEVAKLEARLALAEAEVLRLRAVLASHA